MRYLFLFPILILLSGCQSASTNTTPPSNSTSSAIQETISVDHIQKAALDVAIARDYGIVWLVSDKSTGPDPINMTLLLDLAETEHNAGNVSESLRLAQKVSEIVSLALEQNLKNATAAPEYLGTESW